MLLALVFWLGWKSHKNIRSGILYAVSLSFIGFAGLWDLMNMTFSIVLRGVIIALAFGFR
jgi:ABC-type proline/glycine betaine transport system permease subunit